jgi:hypothetical protein
MTREVTRVLAPYSDTKRSIHSYDPGFDPSSEKDSVSEGRFGGGTLRFAIKGGNLMNRCIRSWFMALALISVNPGLRVPETVDEKEDNSRVASRA